MSPDSRFIPFAAPSLGPDEERAVIEVLRSGWLTTASKAKAFEEAFAARVNAPYAAAVSSGTAGLHLALEAVGVRPGDWVLTTPYTFTATAETIRYLGAHPHFVDIAENGYNIDVAGIEKAIAGAEHKRYSCILPVHIGGEPCDMGAILEIRRRFGIPIVEDAAHAFPSPTTRGYAGTIGDAGVYSFYANKTITTGEGGMVATSDENIIRRIRLMRLHGIDRPIWDRYTAPDPAAWEYDIVEAGYKYNLSDIAAAIGLVQLGKADAFAAKRRNIASRYTEAFEDKDYLFTPPNHPGHAWHLYLLGLRLDDLSISRNDFMRELHEYGIGTSVHYKPLHHMTYYRKKYDLRHEQLPRATSRYLSVISLPIYPDLGDDAVDRIINAVVEIGDSHYRKNS